MNKEDDYIHRSTSAPDKNGVNKFSVNIISNTDFTMGTINNNTKHIPTRR